jgi:hypothetical protein
MFDALGLDEHREAGQFLVAFDQLCAEADITEALVIHHMGHMGERARGDSRLRDWPDVEWRLIRQDDNPASERFITAYGRDVDVPEMQLEYDAATRRLTVSGGSRQDVKTTAALTAVLAAVATAGTPQSGRAIKTALVDTEHSRAAIEQALSFGVRTGALTVETGAHRARLYTASVPASRSVPPVSLDSSVQCPGPFRDGTLGHTEQGQPRPEASRDTTSPPMGISPEAWAQRHGPGVM